MKKIASLFFGISFGIILYGQEMTDTTTILSGEFFDFETGMLYSTEDTLADFAFVLNEGAHIGNEGTTLLPDFRLYYLGNGSLDTIYEAPGWTGTAPWISVSYDFTYGTGGTVLTPGDLFAVYTTEGQYGVVEILGSDDASYIDFAYKYPLGTSMPDIAFAEIWYTNETMTIDGDTSEATWDSIPPEYIGMLESGTIDDSLDLSGFWKAAWDGENLYVLVDVTDQTKFNLGENSPTPYENDNVELFFDVYNDKTGGVPDDIDNIQYRFSWNLLEQTGYKANWEGVEFSQLDKTDGYIFEIKIPWDAIRHQVYFDVTNGFITGFDVAISDNEGSGREAVLNWSNPNSNWLDLSGVGDIQLNGRPPADVEFNVDMRLPLIDSILDPAVDFVDVAGSFNDWGNFIDTLYDVDGDSIYTTTLYGLNAGNTIEYKFRINGSWDPALHERSDEPNRTHMLQDGLNILHHVYDDVWPYNLETREILSPKSMAGLTTSEPVELEIQNTGGLPLDGMNVSYQINGGTIVTETITDTVYPSESYRYTFMQTANFSTPGEYIIKAWVDHARDEDTYNDTLVQRVMHLPIISTFPYNEDFETDEGFWSAYAVQGIMSWEWGTPASGMGLAISGAASGSNCWVTNLSGDHGEQEKSYVLSPVFDLSGMTLPYVSFNKRSASDFSLGASNLQFSVDTGKTWRTIGRFQEDTNWYNIEYFDPLGVFGHYYDGWSGYDSSWMHVAHHIKGLAGQPYVMFRINFASNEFSGQEGFAFDDFNVYEGSPAYNIGITGIQLNEGFECYPTANEDVWVDITNQGLNAVSDIELTLLQDGMELTTDFIADTLYPFDTLSYLVSVQANLYTTAYKGSFMLEAYTYHPSDGFVADDGFNRNLQVFGDYQDQPGYLTYNTCNSGLNENNVWSMLQGDDGDIWFTGFRGISRFDGTNWTVYTTETGLADDFSWASLKDASGNLWFPATRYPQLTKYDGTDFTIIDVPGIFEECAYKDTAGNLWFGSYGGDGVLKYDGVGFIQYTQEEIGLGSIVNAITQHVNGNILVATDGGVAEFDGAGWSEFYVAGNPGMYVTEMHLDSKGMLWIAASNNLYTYDGAKWQTIEQIGGKPDIYIEKIKEDALGNIWFAGGLNVYRFNGVIWKMYSKESGLIPDHYIYSLLPAVDSSIWAGTYRGGVVSFNGGPADTIPYKIITDADLTGNTTWYADTTYLLDGIVYLDSATLTIQPGTVIKGIHQPSTGDNTSMLIITRNAMIDAQGTPEQPIVFTSEFDQMDGTLDIMSRGLWGGVYILGNATVNASGGELPVEGLFDPRAYYGGLDDTDSSGVMRYLSIRHGGAAVDTNAETNGLMLGALGDKTVIEYIEILSSADDGLEAIGGMPNFHHILVAYPGDDAFDTDGGFRGRGQYLAAVQSPESGDNLGEHDGGITNDTDMPESHFQFSNVTYIGNGFGDNNRLLTIRDYAAPEYHNSIFVNQDNGVFLEHLSGAGDSYDQWQNGNLLITNNIFNNVASDMDYDIFRLDDPEGDASQIDIDAWVADFYGQNNDVYDPFVGPEDPVPAGNVDNPDFSLLDPWFEPAEYKGAFSPNGNWAGSWTRTYQHAPYHQDIIVPRGQNWSQSLDPTQEHQLEVYVQFPEWDTTYEDSTYLIFYYGNVDLDMVEKEPHGYVPFNMPDSGSTYVNAYVPVNNFTEVTFTGRWSEDGILDEYMDAFGDTLVEPITDTGYTFIDYPGITLVYEPTEDIYLRDYYDGLDSLTAFIQFDGYMAVDSFFIGTAYGPDSIKSIASFGEVDVMEAAPDSGTIYFYGDALSDCGADMAEYNYRLDTITDSLYFELLYDTCQTRISILDGHWFGYFYEETCPPGYHYDSYMAQCVRDIILGDTSLAAFFPFDGNAMEATGTGIEGTPYGPVLHADRFGAGDAAYYYNGFGDYMDMGNNLQLINGSNQFTITAWINPFYLSGSQNTILGERVPNGQNYQFAVMDHALYFSLWESGHEYMFTGTNGVVMENEWQMVTVTSDGTDIKLYWNDMLDAQFPSSFVPDNAPSDLYLGTWDGYSNMFEGVIDDLRFYNRALTQQEITQLVYEGGYEPVMQTFPMFADAFYNTGAFIIDGIIDEPAWDSIPAKELTRFEFGDAGDPADLSAYWKAAWDQDNLYIMVDVMDESKIYDGLLNPWENDNVELFFDLYNEKQGMVPDQFDNKQYRFIWNSSEQTGQNVSWEGVEYVHSDYLEGYTYEIKIPWSTLNDVGLQIMDGTVFGFDVSVADNDDGVNRESVLNWSNPNSNWSDLSKIGDLQLSGMPPATVTFEVNMSYHAQKGSFIPGVDSVDLAGNFNNWGGDLLVMEDPEGDSIYTTTLELPYGMYLEYKYRINADWGNAEFPGGENRMYTLMDTADYIYHWYNDEFPYDLGVLSVVSPAGGCGLTANETIAVELANNGDQPIWGFEVSYQLDTNAVVSETVSDTLWPMETMVYPFAQSADLSALGFHSLHVEVLHPEDGNYYNNDIYHEIYTSAGVTVTDVTPYFEDFEGVDHGWNPYGQNATWELGMPYQGAISGSNSWATSLSANYNNDEWSFVESPCFDLGSIIVPIISFSAEFAMEGCCDGVKLQFSNDGGQSWHDLYFEGNYEGGTGYRNEYGWSGNSYGTIQVTQPFEMLGGEPDVRFRFKMESDGSVTDNGFTFDDFRIEEGALDYDIALYNILSPLPGCGLTSSENVTVELRNLGKNPVSDINLLYTKDGFNTIAASEVLSDTLQPGAIREYTFASRVDLSVYKKYDFGVRVDYPEDMHPENNGWLQTIFNKPYVAIDSLNHYYEGFEGINFWSIEGMNATWEQGIPAGNVIDKPKAGSYVMATNLTGKYNQEEHSYIESQCFDFSNAVDPRITFQLWTHTEECCDHLSLQFTTNNGVDWTPIGNDYDPYWYNTYEGFAGDTPGWVGKMIGLGFLAGEPNVRFRFAFNADGGYEKEGVALDEIHIYDRPAYDVGMMAVMLPAQSCDYPIDQQITAKIINLGLYDVSGFDIAYQVDNGSIIRENISNSINRDEEFDYYFMTGADLSADGIHEIKVWTEVPGDGIPGNDTLVQKVINKPTINAFPYMESFEGGPAFWTPSSFNGNVSSWELGHPNGGIIKGASEGNNAWATNLNGPFSDNEISWVESPCFDLTSLGSPVLSLDVFSDNEFGTDGAIVQYSADDGMTWNYLDNTGDITNWYYEYADAIYYNSDGDNGWTGNQGGWMTAARDISELAGLSAVKFRVFFASYENYENYDGFAFDNFRIYQRSQNDAGITAIYKPMTNCGLATDTVSVEFKNFGNYDLDSIDLSYQLNGGPVVTERFYTYVYAGDYAGYDFSTTVDVSLPGTYHLKVWTELSNDSVPYNDTMVHVFENQEIHFVDPASPYVEDFESGKGGWYAEGDKVSWEYGMPANNHIDRAASGSYAWVTGLSANYNVYEYSFVYSPCFDLSAMNAPVIELATTYQMESCCDGVMLEYSVDGGNSWYPLGNENEYEPAAVNWYDSYLGWTGYTDGWKKAVRISPELAYEPNVKFRMKMESDGGYEEEGFGFDDFAIYSLPPYDLEMLAVERPQSGSYLTNNEFIEVMIANQGANDISSFSVSYQLESGSARTQNINLLIPSQETKRILLDEIPVDMSITGAYHFDIWVDAAEDSLRDNDTIRDHLVYRKPVINTYPYREDFEQGTGFWHQYGDDPSWEHGIPSGEYINTAGSGDNAWVTNLTGLYNKNEVGFVESPSFDFSNLVVPVLELKIFRHLPEYVDGAAIQYAVGGGNWEYLGQMGQGLNWYNGEILDYRYYEEPTDGWTGLDPNWRVSRHQLERLSGEPDVRFRVVFVSWDWNYEEFSGFEGFAFDDVRIFESAASDDIAPVNIINPAWGSNCSLSDAEPVMVEIRNRGLNEVSSFDISYQVEGNAKVTETINQTIMPGEYLSYEFTTLADLSLIGYSGFEVFTEYAGDLRKGNDTLFMEILNKPLIVPPYSTDFESGPDNWIAGGENETWEWGTPSSANISNANSGVNAWVTNLPGNYNDDEHSFLESPCFDFSGMIQPAIEFAISYSMEECCDGVKLAYSIDGGKWNILDDKTGEMNTWYDNENGWTGEYNFTWRNMFLNVPELAGQQNVRFRFMLDSDGSVTGDGFAMDDFSIFENASDIDVTPVALINPGRRNNCGLTATEPFIVDVKNNGYNPVSGIEIQIMVDYTDTITEVISNTLAPGEVFTYTTTATYDFADNNYHMVEIITTVAGDANGMNDYLMEEFVSMPVISAFPYTEDFELDQGAWIAGGMNSSWEYGSLLGNIIYEDTNMAWVTNAYGPYYQMERSAIESACFDFTSIANPAISFDMWTDIPDMEDGLALQYSNDMGWTWHTLGTVYDDDWYTHQYWDEEKGMYDYYFSGGTGGWVTMTHSLMEIPDLANVKLRFAFGSNEKFEGEGVAIDNISIFEETVYPHAFAGIDKEAYADEKVYLDGSLSTDAYGGSNFTFSWQSLQGLTLYGDTTLNPWFEPAQADTSFTFVLEVMDNANGTYAYDTVEIYILPASGPVHFTNISWTGDAVNPMEVDIVKATLFGTVMEPDDEIALFDGDVMVAAGRIRQGFIFGPVRLVASADDAGTGEIDGFTDGNQIAARVWDKSENTEHDAVLILYKPGSDRVFTTNGYAKAELLVEESRQEIMLSDGWNIVSSYLNPYTRQIDSLFAPLRHDGSLVKVQDESGYSFEYVMGKWMNSIGLARYSEGYKVRVNEDTRLEIVGQKIELPVDIYLREGWNIMGFPVGQNTSAELLLSDLINQDILVKVQDETGASMEYISPIGWVNNIVELKPGEGYKIKVQIPSRLTVDTMYYKSSRVLRRNELEPVKFKTLWNGNGLDHMNIYMNELLIDGEEAATGTEVAVFDGERCVGAGVYNNQFDYLSFAVSRDDPVTGEIEGYTPGHKLNFKVYLPEADQIIENLRVAYLGKQPLRVFEPMASTVVNITGTSGATTIVAAGSMTAFLGENYPNPFSEETRIDYRVVETGKVVVEIIDVLGKQVKTLVDHTAVPGTYTVKWNRMNAEGNKVEEGIYLYRMRTGDQSYVKRMLVIE